VNSIFVPRERRRIAAEKVQLRLTRNFCNLKLRRSADHNRLLRVGQTSNCVTFVIRRSDRFFVADSSPTRFHHRHHLTSDVQQRFRASHLSDRGLLCRCRPLTATTDNSPSDYQAARYPNLLNASRSRDVRHLCSANALWRSETCYVNIGRFGGTRVGGESCRANCGVTIACLIH
jgi:hypothetical protein